MVLDFKMQFFSFLKKKHTKIMSKYNTRSKKRFYITSWGSSDGRNGCKNFLRNGP